MRYYNISALKGEMNKARLPDEGGRMSDPFKKAEIITFIRGIGIRGPWAECKPGPCPSHGDCGICRYGYMKKEGWLK